MNVFDLSARLRLDSSEYDSGLKKSRGVLDKFGKALKTVSKLGAVTFSAAGAAASFLVKNVVSAYADYEQLVGGVETLFGAGGKSLEEYAASVGTTVEKAKDGYDSLMAAQKIVMFNADRAYKTAGMDANSYMEMVTSLSASLIQSLDGDTARAAEVADMAIQDMSDNANKMGTDMESIQNAYKGFSKQNFTMLDNLKLGYGGTKTEMERLLKDAEKIQKKNGKLVKYNINNLSDIVEAIHVVQDEMGITGTTAEEASDTISGSLNSTKAAWKNMLIAFGTGNREKIKSTMDALVSSGKDLAKNLVPVVKNAFMGIATFVEEMAPIIQEELPGFISEVLPHLLEAAKTIIMAVIENIPALLEAIWPVLKELIRDIVEWLNANYPEVMAVLTEIYNWFVNTINDIVTWWNETGASIFSTIWEAIKTAVQVTIEVFSDIYDWFVRAIEDVKNWWDTTGSPIFSAVWNWIVEAVNNTVKVFDNIYNWFVDAINSVKEWWDETGKPIFDMVLLAISLVINAVKTVFNNIYDWFVQAIEDVKAWWDSTGSPIFEGVKSAISTAINAVETVFNNVYTWFSNAINDVKTWWDETGKPIFDGVKDAISTAINTVETVFNNIYTWFSNAINDVKTWWDETGKPIFDMILLAISLVINAVKTVFDNVYNWFVQAIEDTRAWWDGTGKPIFDTIGSAISTAIEAVKSVFDSVSTWFSNAINSIKTWWDATGRPIFDNISLAISLVVNAIKTVFDSIAGWFSGAINSVSTWWSETGNSVFTTISEAITGAWNTAKEVWDGVAEFFSGIWQSIQDDPVLSKLANAITRPFRAAINTVKAIWNGIKSFFTGIWKFIKGDSTLSGLLTDISQPFVDAWNTITTAWGGAVEWASGIFTGIRDAVVGAFNGVIESVKSVISWVKELLGLGGSGVTVDTSSPWYGHGGSSSKIRDQKQVLHADAMSGGRILHGMTPFGIDSNGRMHYGGEAGAEAVVGVNSLDRMIRNSVRSAMADVLGKMDSIIARQGAGTKIVLDTGVLVGETVSDYNDAFSDVANWKGGGRA